MKRRFLRILPLAVAVLLATSCNKDENNDNEVVNNGIEVVTPENTVKTVPFTLKVKNGKGISKVSYADNGEEVQPSFKVGDKVTISGTSISDTELTCETVENGAAVFTGDIASGIEDGTKLTATVKVNENSDIVSSTTSMLDLIEKCAHNYEGTFEYTNGEDAECTLKDDKSYLEFTLAEGQKQVSVNGTWYDVNQTSHNAWVAVEGGTTVTTRIKGSKDVTAGVIYIIVDEDYIDLGPEFNVLWKTENETGSSYSKEIEGNTYYVFDYSDDSQRPTKENFENLIGNTTFSFDNSTYGKKGATFTTEQGTLFFPAAGYGRDFQDAGTTCCYWTRTIDQNYTYSRAYRFDVNANTEIKEPYPNEIINNSMVTSWQLSVRFVRAVSQ